MFLKLKSEAKFIWKISKHIDPSAWEIIQAFIKIGKLGKL
jgi:hypothetical protein